MTRLHSYLNFAGNAQEAFNFYRTGIFEALSEGAGIEMPIADQAWGGYYGALKDKFGVMWMVNYTPPRVE